MRSFDKLKDGKEESTFMLANIFETIYLCLLIMFSTFIGNLIGSIIAIKGYKAWEKHKVKKRNTQ